MWEERRDFTLVSISPRNLRQDRTQRPVAAKLISRSDITNSTLSTQTLVDLTKMSDNGEVEVENPAGNYAVLPKDVTAEIGSIKLFNKWSYEDVEIRDISLT